MGKVLVVASGLDPEGRKLSSGEGQGANMQMALHGSYVGPESSNLGLGLV